VPQINKSESGDFCLASPFQNDVMKCEQLEWTSSNYKT